MYIGKYLLLNSDRLSYANCLGTNLQKLTLKPASSINFRQTGFGFWMLWNGDVKSLQFLRYCCHLGYKTNCSYISKWLHCAKNTSITFPSGFSRLWIFCRAQLATIIIQVQSSVYITKSCNRYRLCQRSYNSIEIRTENEMENSMAI